MQETWEIIKLYYWEYYTYLTQEILHPSPHSYFYWLWGISVLVWLLEMLFPWRTSQSVFRKDFWLDGFYMVFNFFLFSLIGYYALSNISVDLFDTALKQLGINNLVAIHIGQWPVWSQYLLMFVIADFIHWNVHRMLHFIPWLWQFHKLHHSVKEMGFAAHLRFHWMETVIYKTVQYIPLSMIGFGIQDFFVIHMFTTLVGHLNHANLDWNYGPLRYIFNNPRMHIWHHAKFISPKYPNGANYAITLSLWDYLFGTAYIPQSGRDIELGFEGEQEYPKSFIKQFLYPLTKKR